jgi:hypothetical protein
MISQSNLLLTFGLLICGSLVEAQDPTLGSIGESCTIVTAIDVHDVNKTRMVFETQAARLNMVVDDIYLHPTVVDLIEQVKAAGKDENGNDLATLDTYYCSQTSISDGEILIQYAVCNSATAPSGCWVQTFFHDVACPTTSLCSNDDVDNDGDADPAFTSDCSGVYSDYPNCKIECGKDEGDSCGLVPDMTGGSGAVAAIPNQVLGWGLGAVVVAMGVALV